MVIFLSWSGARSRTVASALALWLPQVIQAVRLWMSSDDIDKGARWSAEIGKELDASSFGIVCVTPENLNSPWLNFEAGALSKKLEGSRVIPYLLDMRPGQLSGPLSQFQASEANESDTLKLVNSINKQLNPPLDEERLKKSFAMYWPELERLLNDIPAPAAPVPQRSSPEMIEEMLLLVRDIRQAQLREVARESLVKTWTDAVRNASASAKNAILIETILGKDPEQPPSSALIDLLTTWKGPIEENGYIFWPPSSVDENDPGKKRGPGQK